MAGRHIPEVGSKAPAFTLPDQNGKKVSLSSLAGKWVVLYFYPKDNTPGCTVEGIEFTAKRKEFERIGAIVYGVSADSRESHCTFIKKRKLGIALLTDADKKVMQKYGAWGDKKLYGRSFLGITRSTFLIDPKGKIAYVWKSVKAKGHAEQVLKRLTMLA